MRAVEPSVSADLSYWDEVFMRGNLPPAPHRRISQHLIRHLPRNAHVLVAGSGCAQVPRDVAGFREDLSWTLADQSGVALERAILEAETSGLEWRSRVATAECDLSGMWPFDEDGFDVVLAIGLLEFLPDPVRAIAEAKRVARSQFVVTMPAKPGEGHCWHFDPVDPWRLLGGTLIRAHHLMARPGCILAFVTL